MQYFQIEKKRERNVHSDVVIRFPETKILVFFFFLMFVILRISKMA